LLSFQTKIAPNKLNFAAITDVRTPSMTEGTYQSHQGWGTEMSPIIDDYLLVQIPLELSRVNVAISHNDASNNVENDIVELLSLKHKKS
jgi:hypothetical protein